MKRTFRACQGSGRRGRTFVSWFKARRPTTSRSPIIKECPAGVEPALPAWKAGTFAARSRARKAPAGGIEPPICDLTGRCLTVWPHRIISVRTAGFEPAISCSRGTRNTRLSYVLNRQSAQRESNPHFRHGKAVGFRYIMGAFRWHEIVKDPVGREALESSSPGLQPGAIPSQLPAQ